MVPKPISNKSRELKKVPNKSTTPYADNENSLKNRFLDTREYIKDNTCITSIITILIIAFFVLDAFIY